MTDLLSHCRAQTDAVVQLLATLVELESFTAAKPEVDQLVNYLEQHLATVGTPHITRIPQTQVGDCLLVKWNADLPSTPILVLMHVDTVWQIGTLTERPLRFSEDGLMFAPGVLDMKGGLAVAIHAMKVLHERDELPARPIWFLFTSDEETGSVYAEPIIRELASQVGLVLVMEPPTSEGAIKTARKGVAQYLLSVQGRAAHAGNAPEEGINAITEMAHQIIKISRLQNLQQGVSVAVNTVKGGFASNVIADFATADIDVRTLTQYDMDQVHEALMSLYPMMPGAELEMHLDHMRPPMERNATMQKTFNQARALAQQLGMSLYEDSVGGGSDGNITGSMGIPTLDGLGARGTGLHALHEHVVIRSLGERVAHIASILRDWKFD